MDNKDLTGLGAFAPIILELYKDMAQPAARNVGLALSAVTSVGVFLHLLTSWGNERLNLCLKNNLEVYAERIKDVPQDSIVEASPEIAIPIIEKLSYVTNEELRNLYVELLAKASIKDELPKAHPSFVNIINSISPDEANLLSYFKKNENLKTTDFYTLNVKKSEAFSDFLFQRPDFIKLQYSENLEGYLENFEGLGIIYMTESNTAQVNMFHNLDRALTQALSKLTNSTLFPLSTQMGLNSQKQSLYVTNYGNMFIKAVIEERI